MLHEKSVVIDTNVWVSAALTPGGACADTIRTATENYNILQSKETLDELENKLATKFEKVISPEQRSDFMDDVREVSTEIELTHQVDAVPKDPDDNKFLGLALSGGADQVISTDPHLTNLKHYQGVQIWTPGQFVQREITFEQDHGPGEPASSPPPPPANEWRLSDPNDLDDDWMP